jgi:hypothetical protein
VRRRPARRACFEPISATRRCRSATGRAAPSADLQARRARSACRVRADFTGRGFGSVRLREAR